MAILISYFIFFFDLLAETGLSLNRRQKIKNQMQEIRFLKCKEFIGGDWLQSYRLGVLLILTRKRIVCDKGLVSPCREGRRGVSYTWSR